jgi:hypothetical protein
VTKAGAVFVGVFSFEIVGGPTGVGPPGLLSDSDDGIPVAAFDPGFLTLDSPSEYKSFFVDFNLSLRPAYHVGAATL